MPAVQEDASIPIAQEDAYIPPVREYTDRADVGPDPVRAGEAGVGFCPSEGTPEALVPGSDGLSRHVVLLEGPDPWCSCKGFQYRGSCRHVRLVAQLC